MYVAGEMKKFLISKAKTFFYKIGYELKPLGWNKNDSTFLESNFRNLAKNYELLFTQNFGEVPLNERRIELLKELDGTPPSEAYFIINALHKTRNIIGEVCEFGSANGRTSQLIANEILKDSKKQLHLFDSFEGLPKPTKKDILKDDMFNLGSIEAYEGTMKTNELDVMARLQKVTFPKTRRTIHKGFIEDLIKDRKSFPNQVSFAYIDFDFYEPIKITLDFLHSASNKGAIFIVDDYDFFSTGVKTAVTEFLEENKDYNLYVPDTSFGYFAILTKV